MDPPLSSCEKGLTGPEKVALAIRKVNQERARKIVNKSFDKSFSAYNKRQLAALTQSFVMKQSKSLRQQNKEIISEMVKLRQYATKVEDINLQYKERQSEHLIAIINLQGKNKRLIEENASLREFIVKHQENCDLQVDAEVVAMISQRRKDQQEERLWVYSPEQQDTTEDKPIDDMLRSWVSFDDQSAELSPLRPESVLDKNPSALSRDNLPSAPSFRLHVECPSDVSHEVPTNENIDDDDSTLNLKLPDESDESFTGSNVSVAEEENTFSLDSNEENAVQKDNESYIVYRHSDSLKNWIKSGSRERNSTGSKSTVATNSTNGVAARNRENSVMLKPDDTKSVASSSVERELLLHEDRPTADDTLEALSKFKKRSNAGKMENIPYPVANEAVTDSQNTISLATEQHDACDKLKKARPRSSLKLQNPNVRNKRGQPVRMVKSTPTYKDSYDFLSNSKDSFLVDDEKRIKLPTSGAGIENEVPDSRPLRRRKTVVSYIEPSIGRKLRRGDKHTDSSLYNTFSPKRKSARSKQK